MKSIRGSVGALLQEEGDLKFQAEMIMAKAASLVESGEIAPACPANSLDQPATGSGQKAIAQKPGVAGGFSTGRQGLCLRSW